MKKRWLIIGLAIITLMVVLAVLLRGYLSPWRTLASLQKVDDYPLYVMTYYGDYGFKELLRTGRQPNLPLGLSHPVARDAWACSVFAALGESGAPLLGRNFDWHNRSTLLLYTDPPDGYASVSLVDVSYVGYDVKNPSWADRVGLLATPYWPFDGMNEAGLAVGMMAVPSAKASRDPQRVTLDSLQAIRLLLDYAQNVDEAIVLLQKYNIDFGSGPPLHYLIADAARNAVVVEFAQGEMKVLRRDQPWQVSTNFVISAAPPVGAHSPCWRYNQAYTTLEQTGGVITPAAAMSLLKDVSQENTMWSVVYGLSAGDIQVAMGRKYNQVKEFTLPMPGR